MIRTYACVLAAWMSLCGSAGVLSAQESIAIDRDNIEINRSVRIRPGTYQVQDADGNGVLQVTKDGIEIDFQGATLQSGDPHRLDLTLVEGIGLSVEGHRDVTVRNARIHGYFFNIRAMQAAGLKLENCDVSFSRSQRIAAGGAPVEIWLVLRSLEAWRSYGAGIWLEGCDESRLQVCRGSGSQNGLLLVDSSDCTVTGCDFSYNSGFGVGLWNSSRNVVAFNRLDFVNRPWGGGWGGDSAALVVVNSSHENCFVGNSLTHGGDGFFLTDRRNGGFSERRPVTRFEGSCDRNLVAHNDGSWSTANAFEGTFSFGNVYYRNIANHSNFGFWLGYSSDTLVIRNEMVGNHSEGVAIEHGHGNMIEGNRMEDHRGAAVALWSAGPEWLLRLHPSRDSDIRGNIIRNCGRTFRLDGSTGIAASANLIENTPETEFPFSDRPPRAALAEFEESPQFRRLQQIMADRPREYRLLRDEPGPRGVEWLVPEEYAPRDYRGKIVAWRNRDAATLELLPIRATALSFEAPAWVEVKRAEEGPGYVAAAKDQPGVGETKPYVLVAHAEGGRTQTITGEFLTAQWDVRWYRWDRPLPLRYEDAEGWEQLFKSDPIHRQLTRELSSKLWTAGRPENVPGHHFALVASTQIRMDAGRYRVSTLSDDGIRVFLDGKEIISRWNHHGPTPDQVEVSIAEGVHEWRVHYCQEDGASALSLNWRRLSE